MAIFISWSGGRSRSAASCLRTMLKQLFADCEAWMSTEDLQFGTQTFETIRGQIQSSKAGILCITPENLDSQWLMFEAGGIAMDCGDSAPSGGTRGWRKAIVFLIDGEFSILDDTPLKGSYAVRLKKDDFWKLIRELNESECNGRRESEFLLEQGFERVWPEFEESMKEVQRNGNDWSPVLKL